MSCPKQSFFVAEILADDGLQEVDLVLRRLASRQSSSCPSVCRGRRHNLDDQGVGAITRFEKEERKTQLGPVLCWAVVFADIGTSVYYVPGILYGSVGSLAGFFVIMTMSAFVLLTLKYAEVTHRFPQGGGVVTVASQAMNHWVGALGGMFILVDYFLTAAISCISGILYLSVVIPAIEPFALMIAIGTLVLLGILNWFGISASAKVSLVVATVAFLSDIALLLTVFAHLSIPEFLSLFPRMFASRALTPTAFLIGFAGSFLAFSGLESISQLSPVMKSPRKRVSGIALALVVLTVGLTSPLLTMFATLLLPKNVVGNPILSSQMVSLLGGHWGSIALETEIAISASALLIFASNTAIIGAYYVFMALSRMQLFPAILLQRNKLRGTPHYAILLATVIPIIPLLLVNGAITLLGDMYAFGLLGAFTLTCLGLDIVRRRERKAAQTARASFYPNTEQLENRNYVHGTRRNETEGTANFTQGSTHSSELTLTDDQLEVETTPSPYTGGTMLNFWHTFKFYIGLLTTAIVFTAWTTNLVAKPLATAFGGTITIIGMSVAYFSYARHKRKEHLPVAVTHTEEYLPGSTLAVLAPDSGLNVAIIHSALNKAEGKAVVFLYLGFGQPGRTPNVLEFHDPYYDDEQAKKIFGTAEHLAQGSRVRRLYLYRQLEPHSIERVRSQVHPYDTIIAAEHVSQVPGISADRILYEVTPEGRIAHFLKRW
jgi:amino acid transporter